MCLPGAWPRPHTFLPAPLDHRPVRAPQVVLRESRRRAEDTHMRKQERASASGLCGRCLRASDLKRCQRLKFS